MDYHEWICHSNFSFLLGASHPVDLIKRAIQFGYGSLAFTDFDGVYGVARAYGELKKLKQLGVAGNLKLHTGAEIHLAIDHHLPVTLQDTLVLIALSLAGYQHLNRILTLGHTHGKKNAHVSLETLLKQDTTDIAAIMPMRGLIRRLPADAFLHNRWGKEAEAAANRLGKMREHFPGRFYLAVSRHLHPAEDAWIMPTMRLAQKLGSPILMTQDVFFHRRQQKPLSDLLHAIRLNACLDEVCDQLFVNDLRHLMSLAHIEKIYGELPGYDLALRQSAELAERIHFDLSELRYHYPQEMIPEGMSAQAYLEQLSWKHAGQFYGEIIPDKIQQVLRHELALISELEFADYFLTVFDIVSWARSQSILCQGRGSAANSAVCFVLGITSVDPNCFDLLFERFISLERGDPPDIDVDFEHERREEVIQYIYRRYGRNRAAMVANVICFKRRGALRFAGNALGIPEKWTLCAARVMDSRANRHGSQEEWTNAMEEKLAESDACPSGENKKALRKKLALWSEMSARLYGFPRHLGIHSGGFIVSDQPMDMLCPQEPATMPGRTVIEWCKEDIEAVGFFKIDVLALGMLTAIRKCFDLLAQKYAAKLSLATIPPDDPATYAMIRKADTVGVFQIESRAQMSFLPRHLPLNFYDLVVQVAIIRPGPIQGGMIHPYLRRRDGLEKVEYPDPRLIPILQRTYGVPIFQEQVMRVAMAVGGFSAGEADELRKNIGSFNLKGNVDLWLSKLVSGMRRNGIPEDFIESLMRQMQGFSSYGFPESHAASFAHLAYASAFLKCHFPAAFFASVMNSQPMGFYAIDTLIKTAQQLGVVVLPICILKSAWDHTLEEINDPQEHINSKPQFTTTAPLSKLQGDRMKQAAARRSRGVRRTSSTLQRQDEERTKDCEIMSPCMAIRLGLRLVVGVCAKNVQAFLVERNKKSEFRIQKPALEEADAVPQLRADIFRSGNLNRTDLTALAAAGALSPFGIARKDAIWLAEAFPYAPMLDVAYEQGDMTTPFPQESELSQVQLDYRATTTSLGRHPAVLMKENAWPYAMPLSCLTLAKDFKNRRSGESLNVFGMVVCRQAPPTAKGMVFVTLWDESGSLNLVFRPDVHKAFHRLIDGQGFLCAAGKMQRDKEARSILVFKVFSPLTTIGKIISWPESSEEKDAAAAPREPFVASRNYM